MTFNLLKILCTTLIVLFINPTCFSQENFKTNVLLNWTSNDSININASDFDFSTDSKVYLGLKAYHNTVALDENETLEASLQNVVSVEINVNELDGALIDVLSSEFKIETVYKFNRGEKIAHINIEAFKKGSDNKIYKLISFTINNNISKIIGKTAKRVYSDNSVLSSGDWYKVAVSKSGIYKISGSDLQAMGFSLSSLSVENVHVHGNGGGVIPEANSDFRYDDIIENAIKIVDNNSNGLFDASDYLLFYAKGPNTWKYSSSKNSFNHTKNIYDDYAYYFVTINNTVGKRISDDPNTYSTANVSVDKFTDYAFHELDSLNLIKTGRVWYGEHYSIEDSHVFNFSFPNIVSTEKVLIKTNSAARSTLNSTMYFNVNGTERIISYAASSTDYLAYYAQITTDTFNFYTSNSSITVNTTYTKPNSSSQAWMNFIEVNARRYLTMSAGQMTFSDPVCVATNVTAEYTIENANSEVEIWDVSNSIEPMVMSSSLSNTSLKFVASADSLRTYVSHYGGYYSPIKIGKVSNQNLHALSNIDYVIIYDSRFKSQVEKLAAFHRNNSGLSVYTTILAPIYNEFGSGAQDISAIRDFMKMLYDKADGEVNKMPKYLLFFGDASYDYKNRVSNNTNLIPTYESPNSLSPKYSYCTDDFFGLYDNGEGANAEGDLDIGIGRFPITTVEQASGIVNKILDYQSTDNNIAGEIDDEQSGNAKMSDWRNKLCFIGDDEDSGIHTDYADDLARYVAENYPVYNIDKIYFDAYNQVTTPAGQRYPDVNTAINQTVENGSLIVNYTGHGGEEGWSHESVLNVSDINAWTNISKLPLFITATCEFSRYDDPERISAGEYVLLNSGGGGIALLTTSRVSYSNTNQDLNVVIFENILKENSGKYPRLGDIIRLAKVGSGSVSANKNFLLLGDPAMKLVNPEHEVVTTNIRDAKTGLEIDTLNALQIVNISGNVMKDGSIYSDFNGRVMVTIFDKVQTYSTLGNDEGSPVFNFELQKNIIYKGKVNATNGEFNFDFVVPKDIAYNIGNGKISYYATDGVTDANGYTDTLSVGGSYFMADVDEDGPELMLYINDTNFIDGGITDENPNLLAYVFDEHGINTVGNGIGHDITAIIDANSTSPMVLNEYYEAKTGDYKSGIISYPFYNLEDGSHTLDLKVWDVYNNSATASITFVVAANNMLAMEHLFNQPNPFKDQTSIVFEHNQSDNLMDVEVRIYNSFGKLVKIISTNVNSSGYRVGPGQLVWDGTNANGQKLATGLYVYNLRYKLTDSDGEEMYKELSNKMVLIK